jgi:Na+/citrate or Na+/malate symporter
MNNDPDIIRWSQIKRFFKHTFAWMAVYGIGGWLIDVTRYSEQSTTSHFIILVALSVLMAFVTMQRN